MNWAKRVPPSSPPDKGSFPLDHFGECKEKMEVFMSCLKQSSYNQGACRAQSREYLQCRMDNELMADEDLDELGFRDVKPKNIQQDNPT